MRIGRWEIEIYFETICDIHRKTGDFELFSIHIESGYAYYLTICNCVLGITNWKALEEFEKQYREQKW